MNNLKMYVRIACSDHVAEIYFAIFQSVVLCCDEMCIIASNG